MATIWHRTNALQALAWGGSNFLIIQMGNPFNLCTRQCSHRILQRKWKPILILISLMEDEIWNLNFNAKQSPLLHKALISFTFKTNTEQFHRMFNWISTKLTNFKWILSNYIPLNLLSEKEHAMWNAHEKVISFPEKSDVKTNLSNFDINSIKRSGN